MLLDVRVIIFSWRRAHPSRWCLVAALRDWGSAVCALWARVVEPITGSTSLCDVEAKVEWLDDVSPCSSGNVVPVGGGGGDAGTSAPRKREEEGRDGKRGGKAEALIEEDQSAASEHRHRANSKREAVIVLGVGNSGAIGSAVSRMGGALAF